MAKGRAALQLEPTYGYVDSKQDAYLHPNDIRKVARKQSRYWLFNDVPTTVALDGNRFAKSLNGFTHHTDESSFRELLREYEFYNVPRPSGYADVFHEHFKSPRVNYSVNMQLAPCFAGGWQDAIMPGVHLGQHYRYDMRSAYLWAATLGLPDTRTYRRGIRLFDRSGRDGIYRVKLIEPSPGAPFPFDRARECLATNLEIESYNLRVGEVIDGVTWSRTIAGDRIVSAVQMVSAWKQAGRAYWGRWAQSSRIECVAQSGAKRWTLPNVQLNIPWAHLIVSRVKMRLWEYANHAVHVYVDSVITRDVIRTGDSLGDWRLEKVYPEGVIIRGPGQYGDLQERRLEKYAGAAPESTRRDNPVAAVA